MDNAGWKRLTHSKNYHRWDVKAQTSENRLHVELKSQEGLSKNHSCVNSVKEAKEHLPRTTEPATIQSLPLTKELCETKEPVVDWTANLSTLCGSRTYGQM